MNTTAGHGTDEARRSLLDAVADQIGYLRQALDETIGKLDEMARTGGGDGLSARELNASISELRAMSGIALKEESRLEDERRKARAGLHAGAFDLDAARREVGERLARLRAARSDGTIPGGTE